MCIDVENYSIEDQATIYVYACHTDDKQPDHQNQEFSVNANGTITLIMSGKCLDVSDYGTTPGSQVWQYHCTGATNQQWTLNPVAGGGVQIVNPVSGLCLDAGTVLPGPCDPGQNSTSLPFCNTTLPFPDRVNYILGQIQAGEVAGLFNTQSSGVSSLNIPNTQWWSEALHGVAGSPGVHFGGAIPGATSFPQVCTTGMAFNRQLWHTIGSIISTEARAMNNNKQAGLTYWAPNINIFRDPRWGRGQETPGEDPFLTSAYVENFVKGMQEGDDPRYLKVSSCCKHYAAYSLEDWGGQQRYGFNAIVTDQDEVDTYLPAFQSCVEKGRVSSLMCSYNAVNGIPSCANDFLMTTIAREEWGFTGGYITSDCDAVDNILNNHHYVNNTNDLARVVLAAGMDIDCGGALTNALPGAIAAGTVTPDMYNRALYNLFTVRMRLGEFDPSATQPYRQITPDAVCTNFSKGVALDAAQQGITLVKNSPVGNTKTSGLPLSKTSINTIAVIGPNANNAGVMQSNYAGTPCPGTLIPVTTTLAAYATVNYVYGCDIASTNTTGIAAAVTAAQNADATVLVMGLDLTQEAEGHDRTIVTWPGVQETLINDVCAASKGPCILVIMAGGSVDISAELGNANIGAIIWAGYPGQAGGEALAQTIFGDNVPSGRLVQTLYPGNFPDMVSFFEYNVRPGPSQFAPGTNPGRTHRFYTGQVVLPFGYGLSYTTFSYSLNAPAKVVSLGATRNYLTKHAKYGAAYAPLDSEVAVSYWVNVTNTGSVDARDAVLGFLVPPGAGSNGVPLQELFGFDKVLVPAGQTVTVYLGVQARHLTVVNKDAERVAVPGTWKLRVGVENDQGMGFVEHEFVAQ
jgi:beta-glucosidase-like glycosyl hydrolase